MTCILIDRSLFIFQIGQTIIPHVQGCSLSVDIGDNSNDVVVVQFAFSGYTCFRKYNRFLVHCTSRILQLLIGENITDRKRCQTGYKSIRCGDFFLCGLLCCYIIGWSYLCRFFLGKLIRYRLFTLDFFCGGNFFFDLYGIRSFFSSFLYVRSIFRNFFDNRSFFLGFLICEFRGFFFLFFLCDRCRFRVFCNLLDYWCRLFINGFLILGNDSRRNTCEKHRHGQQQA